MDYQRTVFYGMRQQVLKGRSVDKVIWSMIGDAITDLVFIFLYGILLILNIFNVIKHGVRREGGYILLLMVSACMFTA